MSKAGSNVDRIHQQLRQMAADFEFMPDARINESALATQLDASRTPIREALNRLVAEGYLTFQSRRGFFCRPLNPKRIHDLYEARSAIECEGLRRAVERASDSDIARATADLNASEPTYDKCNDPIDLLAMDEAFHMQLVGLSGNDELIRMLENLNGRVRYVRLINLRYLRSGKPITAGKAGKLSGHRKVLIALAKRNQEGAVRAMRDHIERRREETTEAVRIAYSQLYVPGD